jgi:glycosyltransferase involved in cell wall biosynthesis
MCEKGKIELPDSQPAVDRCDRLLVTFALFAYNQEKYIRDAVEGAFSQTYEPLEIILSDDCSTDRTFEIMQEMAAAYRGPHKLTLNRNSANLGIGPHYNSIFEKANGHLVVVAAGDDISLPSRVSVMMAATEHDPNAYAFCSAYRELESSVIHQPSPPASIEELFSRKKWLLGATAAYKPLVYSGFGCLNQDIRNEDAALALRALILGNIQPIAKPLVVYRSTGGVSGSDRTKFDPRIFKKVGEIECLFRRNLIRQWRKDLNRAGRRSGFGGVTEFRLKNAYLFALARGRRIKPLLIKMYIARFGVKAAAFQYLGYRLPGVLNQYLRIRYFRYAIS